MAVLESLERLFKGIDFGLCYLTIQLGRGVFFSFALLGIVLLLRRTVFHKTVFGKGLLWSFFLLLPFMGRLKFFYETRFGIRGFFWWHQLCVEYLTIGRIYFLGIAVFAGVLLYRRAKLRKFVSGMEREERFGTTVYVCESEVTPFTTGCIRPKIVFPRRMLESGSEEELRVILLHEKTHIRLGHLWCYFLWDALRALFWANPFLTVCMKYFREDMESICDRVTIQSSRQSAWDYGRVLLKSIRLLQQKKKGLYLPVTFAGEVCREKKEYGSMKRRILRIAQFRQYKPGRVCLLLLLVFVLLTGSLGLIKYYSYPRYTALTEVSIYDEQGRMLLLDINDGQAGIVTFDEDSVYIRAEELKALLLENGIEEEILFVVFGGFMKLPGMGGGCDCVYVEQEELTGETIEIAYERNTDYMSEILKNI